jgi:alpha-ketoglutarate-dependent taurine dioxygenase
MNEINRQKKQSLGNLETIRRKIMKMSQSELVDIKPLIPGKNIPVVIQPVVEGVNLLEWLKNNRELIDQLLLQHRALLFRNFGISQAEQFNQFIQATSNGELLEYCDRSSPRHELSNKIYTSTDYPAQHSIFLHNEGTYWLRWPLKIYFCCLINSLQGGQTPIADCRNIFARIDPKIRERFIDKKILYVRNYNDGLGLTWQTVFQTEDKAKVEEYCRDNAIEYEWKDSERLKTRFCRPSVAQHPQTGELVWFNHGTFFHVSTLENTMREALSFLKDEDLPNNTYYGDGSPIEASVLDELRHAYAQEKITFSWQAGDILMLDNMSVAHGREPFIGERKVLVGMAEPFSRKEI